VRAQQGRRGQPEMKRARVGDLEPVIEDRDADGATRDTVVPVAEGIGQGLPDGPRWVGGSLAPLEPVRLNQT
jgi:hypothetical protein